MNVCIQEGLYAHAINPNLVTRIGISQVGGGTDHSIAALRDPNSFPDTTRSTKDIMVGEALPPHGNGWAATNPPSRKLLRLQPLGP